VLYFAPMPTGTHRDVGEVRVGLARWVAAHPALVPGTGAGGPAAAVVAVTPAAGGMTHETLLVDLGPGHPGMVVRLPPLEPTFPDHDLAPQAAVQNAVAACGVPAPAPAVLVSDPAWIGSPFLAMPRVVGDIPGPAPLFDPYLRDADPALQRQVHDGLVDTVAAIHAVPWAAHGLGRVLAGEGLRDALARWESYVAWSSNGDPLPALAESLAWCRRHVPAERPPVLLWGDPRPGNLVFGPTRRVRAVLDWDLASLGPPEMDLGWHLGLEFAMAELFGSRLPGFPDRGETVERYEHASGLGLEHLDWHEVFALVRALAINDRHLRITGDPRRRENPMGHVLQARLEQVAG
jgi:aminoglycoside phosphotransferase (APT) family kinase protein